MKLTDRKELKSLIAEVIDVTTRSEDGYKRRDLHFELGWNYNDGDDYWYLAHDGNLWNINDFLKPSQNQFKSMDAAIAEFKDILENVIKDG